MQRYIYCLLYTSQEIGGLSDGSDKFYFIKDPQGFSIEIIEEK